MVWHHSSLQSVSVFYDLSVMVVQVGDGIGDCLGLSVFFKLGVNGASLGELVYFEVTRVLLEVLTVE